MSSGRVSVIVPTYQHQEYLRCSILSILNSTIPVEVIVVPVASDKPTLEELNRLKDSFDGRVSIVISDKADPFYQMQLGLDNVETEYFLAFGSDDYLLPNAVRRMLEIAVWSNADNPIAALSYAYADENLNITGAERLRPFSNRRMQKRSIIPDFALVKTENAKKVGGFIRSGKDFGYLNHFAFYLRLIRLPGTQVIISPDMGCLYRQLPNSRHALRYSTRDGIRLHRAKIRDCAKYYLGG